MATPTLSCVKDGPAQDVRQITKAANYTAGDYDIAASNGGQAAIVKVVGTGGSLVVTTNTGRDRTLTVGDDEEIPVAVRVIKQATDVATLRLYFAQDANA